MHTEDKNKSFPIVGMGASAGGLSAYTQLLKALPADTGMAFVLVQHLDSRHASMLSELLARATSMPVIEITDGLYVEPNHVYVRQQMKTLLQQDKKVSYCESWRRHKAGHEIRVLLTLPKFSMIPARWSPSHLRSMN